MLHRRAPELIVVGAGIVGLAHALAAARRGFSVRVIDRDAQANGASIRNFGFITVTGQERGRVWSLARRSAQIWREIAPQAGIPIEQNGLLVVARRPEAADVLAAFAVTEMGEECVWLSDEEVVTRFPMLRGPFEGALESREDLRVESRTAIPLLARWLEQAHGVRFARGVAVRAVESGTVHLADGTRLEADAIVVCPGDDFAALFPEQIASEGLTRSMLQMLRLAAPGWWLRAPVMSDLSLVRYLGYAALPEAAALAARLSEDSAEALAHGVHLIAVQSGDGSLVVGDSHHYAATPPPFASSAVEAAILREYETVFGPATPVIERWTGTYASGPAHSVVREPLPGVRLAIVTSGTGASTGFALAEEVVAELCES